MLKPATNFWTTYRRLAQTVSDGTARREVYQPMARWVADNPNFPGRAWAEWVQLIYRDGTLATGRARLGERLVDLGRIEQNLLVITAGADHIAPRGGTMPIFDLVASADVTHIDRPGGHIGLIAGSAARKQIWPDIAQWLAERSQP
jgi:polyhydroxyalkanoate synthase